MGKKTMTIALAMLLVFACIPCYAFAAQSYDESDLRTLSNLTPAELEQGLQGNLQGYGAAFIEAERTYGVNAVFLASLAALESGWGRNCSRGANNLFAYGRKNFSSKEACISYVTQKLAENYLSEGGRYYEGTSLSAVNEHYNGRTAWETRMRSIMEKIDEKVTDGQGGTTWAVSADGSYTVYLGNSASAEPSSPELRPDFSSEPVVITFDELMNAQG